MKFRTVFKIFILLILFFIFVLYVHIMENRNGLSSQIQKVAQNNVITKISEYVSTWESSKMPELQVITLEGKKTTLVYDTKKPNVYVVWASWCSDCRHELPNVEYLYSEFKEKINFITVNLVGFRGETLENAMTYYNENRFSFPILFDYQKIHLMY